MSTFVNVLILIIITAAVAVTLWYVTAAAAAVAEIKDYGDDPDLAAAHKYLAWTATAAWITIALLIVAIILLFIFGPELAFLWGGILISGLLFLLIGFAITIGVIAAISANSIKNSGQNTSGSGLTAYNDTIIAASVSLGVVGLLIISFIVYYVERYKRDKAIAEAKQKIKALKTRKAIEKLETDTGAAAVVTPPAPTVAIPPPVPKAEPSTTAPSPSS